MFDKTKTTSLEDFDSQLDYMVKVGILNHPKDVMSIGDIQTDWFKGLSYKQKEKEIELATDDWWEYYGKDNINELYSDIIIESKQLTGDIELFWLGFLENNSELLEKYLGLKKYRDEVKRHKARLGKVGTETKKEIKEENDKLKSYIKDNHNKLTDDEIRKLSNLLHHRRMNGGCSMWKNVGIEYLYRTNKDELYDFEIEWYERKFGKINE